jgi:hypothetical protein
MITIFWGAQCAFTHHMLDMVAKFEQEKGHELAVKKTRKKRRTHLKKPKC